MCCEINIEVYEHKYRATNLFELFESVVYFSLRSCTLINFFSFKSSFLWLLLTLRTSFLH